LESLKNNNRKSETTLSNYIGDGFFTTLNYKNLILDGSIKNRWILTVANKIVACQKFKIVDGKVFVFGYEMEGVGPKFYKPFTSTFLNIYQSYRLNFSSTLISFEVDLFAQKMFMSETKLSYSFFPLSKI
jgi:hypothetical protein